VHVGVSVRVWGSARAWARALDVWGACVWVRAWAAGACACRCVMYVGGCAGVWVSAWLGRGAQRVRGARAWAGYGRMCMGVEACGAGAGVGSGMGVCGRYIFLERATIATSNTAASTC
jgi:hypothetical protein